jgi:hypothetical protein
MACFPARRRVRQSPVRFRSADRVSLILGQRIRPQRIRRRGFQCRGFLQHPVLRKIVPDGERFHCPTALGSLSQQQVKSIP